MSPDESRRNLLVLAHAEGELVVLGPIGFAARETEECRAYRALAADRNAIAELQGEITALATRGNPVRRIYAVLLLRIVDAAAARAILETMASSDEPCAITQGGCNIPTGTLGATARALLGREPNPWLG
ncbi:MAG: hypothetical protein ABW133_22725 [Polyangiaceae bacterium]